MKLINNTLSGATSIMSTGNITLQDNYSTSDLTIDSQADDTKSILLTDDTLTTAIKGNIFKGNTSITATKAPVTIDYLETNDLSVIGQNSGYTSNNVELTNSTLSGATSIMSTGNITLQDNYSTSDLTIDSQADDTKSILLTDDTLTTAIKGNIFKGNTSITATKAPVTIDYLETNDLSVIGQNSGYTSNNVELTNSTLSGATSVFSNGKIDINKNNSDSYFIIMSETDSSNPVNITDNKFAGDSIIITDNTRNVTVDKLTLNNTAIDAGDLYIGTMNGNIQLTNSNIANAVAIYSNAGDLLYADTTAKTSDISIGGNAVIDGHVTGDVRVEADTLKVDTNANTRNYTLSFNTLRDNIEKVVLPSEKMTYEDAYGILGYNRIKYGESRADGTTFILIDRPEDYSPGDNGVNDTSKILKSYDTTFDTDYNQQTDQKFDYNIETVNNSSYKIKMEAKRIDKNKNITKR